MFFKGAAEEGGEFVAPLSLVLVVLLGFDRRGAQRGARGVFAVRWIRVSLLGMPKLASTYGLNVRKGDVKGEVLVVVQVVKDLVVRGAKGSVVGGFEGSQNDGPKYVVDGERAHVLKSSADIADFTEVGVDSVLGVDIPGHKASDLKGKKDSLHAFMLERESSEKGFPYLLSAQKLVRAVLVKNGVGVGKLGPQRHKTALLCLQEDCVRVRTMPSMIMDGFFDVVDDQVRNVLGLEELTAERATGQNPTVLDTKGLKESVDVVRDVFVTANGAVSEAGRCWKISRTPGA
jgi:hypothetical protein